MIKASNQRRFLQKTWMLLFAICAAALIWWIVQFQPYYASSNNSGIARVVAATNVEQEEPLTNTEASASDKILSAINDFQLNAQRGSNVAVYFEDLRTGESTQVNGSHVFNSASLYKAFTANETLKLIENGSLDPDSVAVTKRGLSISDCLKLSITVSDNDCGVAMQRLSGALGYLPQLTDQGFVNTDLSGFFPKTTAADIAKLFSNTYNSTYLNDKSTEIFMNSLRSQSITNRIPAYLPESAVVAHKTGDLRGAYHDAGLITTASGNTYVLAILTQDYSSNPTNTFAQTAELSKAIYEIFETE